jgi:hypothetical protein
VGIFEELELPQTAQRLRNQKGIDGVTRGKKELSANDFGACSDVHFRDRATAPAEVRARCYDRDRIDSMPGERAKRHFRSRDRAQLRLLRVRESREKENEKTGSETH